MGKDVVSPNQKTYSTVSEQQELDYLRAMKQSFEKEFSRYKQDCRKKALDLAWQYYSKDGCNGEKKVTETAEFYYNWLISIPE